MKKYLFLLGFFFFFLPIGLGAREKEIKYKNGDIYYGEVKGNKPNGIGTMSFANKDLYKGAWVKGVRTGMGEMRYATRDIYNGEWLNDMREGDGTMKYANGDIYNGSWVRDLKEGEGEMKYHYGDTYKGSWLGDKWAGRGRYTFANGGFCEGEFADGAFLEGTGTLKTKTGEYQGEVCGKDFKQNGQGRLVLNSGNIYEGHFEDGLPNGFGRIIMVDGGEINGIFKNGEPVSGKFVLPNNWSFEGEFKDARPWKGKRTLPNGDWFDGIFDDSGQPKTGTLGSSNENGFKGEFRDGVPFNGVGRISCYGGTFDGEAKNGILNGSFSMEEDRFSFEGKLVNGEPYGTFNGLVPKEHALFSDYFKTSPWPSIESGSDGPGKMSGFKDITARFCGYMDEQIKEQRKRETDGSTYNYSEQTLSCAVSLEGHFVNNIPQDKTTLSWSYRYLSVTHYGRKDGILRRDYDGTISLQWNNGTLTDGEGSVWGIYKYDDQRIDFKEPLSFRSLGSSGYTVQYKNTSKESLEISVEPSPVSLNTFCLGLANKAKEQPKIRENNAHLQEIESIRRNKAPLTKNAVDPDKVVSADRNTVRANPYLNKMTAYTFKLKKITRDRDYKYRIEATSYYDVFGENTFYIATDDPAFADLDYPCYAYVYAKAQKDSEMVFGRTAWDYSYVARYWFLDAIYLGPVK